VNTAIARAAALTYFVGMGWTPAQAAGIVANLVAESDLNPAAVGDGGAAYGIAQWHPDRQANFSAIIGRDIHGSSIDDQLAFVHAELQRWEKAAGDALASCATAGDAGACVSRLYERPADREGEAAKRAALAEKIFAEYKGVSEPASRPQPENSMGAMFIPAILQLIPSLIGLFGGKGERAQQNAGAAQIVVDAFTKAVPGAVNVQQALEMAQANPAVAATAKAAVMSDPAVLGLVEVGGGVVAARTANLALVQSATHWWQLVLNPVFLVTMLTLPLVYLFVWKLIAFLDKVSSDVISQTMGTIIGLVLGSIMGFWMGQTWQQTNKRQGDPPA